MVAGGLAYNFGVQYDDVHLETSRWKMPQFKNRNCRQLFLQITFHFIVLLFASVGSAADGWVAGAAKRDISPAEAIRLSGYAARSKPTSEVSDSLHARALYLKHGNSKPLMLVSIDAIGVAPWMTQTIAEQASRELGLARSQIAICSTHSHSAPHLDGALTNLFPAPLDESETKAIKNYSKNLVSQIMDAMREAVALAKPAKLQYSFDRADFAINRRLGANKVGAGFGTVDEGPVDRTVRVVRVESTDGKMLAVAYQYACHCTSISPEVNRVSGDWAGISATKLESENPGLIALPIIGAGADANPNPRGAYEQALSHGNELARAVKRAMASEGRPLPAPNAIAFSYAGLEFERPDKAALNAMSESKSYQEQNRARGLLDILTKKDRIPESYPAPIHLWTFGKDLAWVFMGGEVVVDYQMRLERELNQYDNVWVSAYVDDVFAYVASERIRNEGGYEADTSMIYYNQPGRWVSGTEDKIVLSVLDLQRQSRSLDEPLSPNEALATIQVPEGWKIEQLATEPLVQDPVNISFGADGKVWVVEMGDYPNGGKPGRVKWLSDDDGDGTLDKSVVFLDNLQFPAGVYAWRGGVVVACAPDVFFARDTDGDGVADQRQVLLSGFALANAQHRVHGFTYGLDHKLYFGVGSDAKEIDLHAIDGSNKAVDIRDVDLALDVDQRFLTTETGETQFIRSQTPYGEWFGNDNSHPVYHFVFDRHWIQKNAPRPRSLYQYSTTPAISPEVFPLSQPLDRFNDPYTANRFTSACSTIFASGPGTGAAMDGAAIVCESVHNLVARFKMERDGMSWKAVRFPEDQRSDWIRSSDPWFRPVRVANAPDGTIWILDMYRRVIEHPTWIPEEWLARLDVRAGQDQGRIYRVFRQDYKPTNKLSLVQASIDELVQKLGDESAAIADLAQQQLIWNHASNQKLAQLLQTELRQSESPRRRVRAIAILLYLNQMASSDWKAAMEDQDARVLKFALHCMSRLDSLPADAAVLVQLALQSSHAQADPSVAMELVFLVGNYAPEAVNSVVQLLKTHHQVQGMETLVDFVANERVDGLVDELLRESDESTNIYLERLIPRVSDQGQSRIVNSIEQSIGDRPAWHYRFARQIAMQSKAEPTISNDVLDSLYQQAKETILREQSPVASRIAALEFCLSKMSDSSAAEIESLLSLSLRVSNIDFAEEILEGIYRLGPGTFARLLTYWVDASEANRSKIVSLMVSQPSSAKLFLRAIAVNQFDSKTVLPSQLEYLRSQGDSELNKLVVSLFGKDQAGNRAELLAAYSATWPKDSSIENGQKLFEQHCSVCHRERDVQGEKQPSVGPALESLNHWTNEAWLVAILDPSRSVDTKYQRLLLRTTSDENVSGLVLRETQGTLEIMTTDGRVQQIARATVEEEKKSAMSLMPDGFEKVLSPQQVSDIVRFLRSQK